MPSSRPHPHVAIVGGGIIGLACAEALSRAGWSVCLIEREDMGRGASWAGGGMLTPLPPDQDAGGLGALFAESLALYPEWCARLQRESGIDPEYWVCGAVQIKADGRRLHYPELSQVRNTRLIKALVKVLQSRGVALHPRTEVSGWVESGGRLCGVATSQGQIACDAAVLAAGARSAALGAEGVVPIKGQMLLASAAPGQLSQILIGEQCYLIPRRDGKLLIGSTLEDVGFDATPTAAAREQLWERGQQLWSPLSSLTIEAHWAGLRPRTATGLPLVGADLGLPGLWHATGHYRLGISLAPGTARSLADGIGEWLKSYDR